VRRLAAVAALTGVLAIPASASAVPVKGVWYQPRATQQERDQVHAGFIVREGGQTLYNLNAHWIPEDTSTKRCGKAWFNRTEDIAIASDGTFGVTYEGTTLEGHFTSDSTAEGTFTFDDPCLNGHQLETYPWTAAWEGGDTPPGGGEEPLESEPPPAPSGEPGCRAELSIGRVSVVAECLREESGAWVAEGRVRINGLDVTAGAGGRLVLDPRNLTIEASGDVTVALGPIVVFRGPFQWRADGALNFSVARGAKLRGLPVNGSIEGRWTPAASELTLHVSLGPDFGGVTGDVTVSATNERGLVVDRLAISLTDSDIRLLGKLALRGASLVYERASDTWTGAISLALPGGRRIDGSLSISDGRFAAASAAADNLNMPLGQVLFLQRIGVGVQARPLTLRGDAAFTGGPRLNAFGRRLSALEGTAGLRWEDGPRHDTWTFSGGVKLASFELGEAAVVYRPGLDVSFSGRLGFEILRAGFEGSVDGWLAGRSRFEGRAAGRISLPLLGGADAEAIVSSEGLGACGNRRILWGSVSGGVTYRWGGSPRVFEGSCDFSDVEVDRSARIAQLGHVVALPGGQRAALLAVRGSGAAPRVVVSGPQGLSIAGADGGAALTDRAYLLEVPEQATTYVVLRAPPAGRYTVAAQPGSAAVTAVGSARALPQPRVTATVRGRGAQRVLSWALRPIAGQRVAFVERGGGVARTIAVTSRRRGSVRFRPARGLGGPRRVVALVRQGGLPRRTLTVARFSARAARVRRVARVQMRRAPRGVLSVRWRRAAGATGYDVRVALRDGRRLLRIAGPEARSARFAGIGRRDRGLVTVVARGLGDRRAPAVRARLRRLR
jgi:hypothetical protein